MIARRVLKWMAVVMALLNLAAIGCLAIDAWWLIQQPSGWGPNPAGDWMVAAVLATPSFGLIAFRLWLCCWLFERHPFATFWLMFLPCAPGFLYFTVLAVHAPFLGTRIVYCANLVGEFVAVFVVIGTWESLPLIAAAAVPAMAVRAARPGFEPVLEHAGHDATRDAHAPEN